MQTTRYIAKQSNRGSVWIYISSYVIEQTKMRNNRATIGAGCALMQDLNTNHRAGIKLEKNVTMMKENKCLC